MTVSAECSPRRTRSTWEPWLSPPVWAVPFALFFGTLAGPSWPAYREAYVISLVYAYVIRLGMFGVERLVAGPLRFRAPAGRYPWLREGSLFFGVAMLAATLAAYLVDRFLVPGFVRSGGSWLRVGAYSVAISLLCGAIVYARVFYRAAVERAVALERVRGDLARAELRALRARVHPHFLFNTLNTIASLIAENPRAAEDTVTRLADVFRYALTATEREHVRLADELEFLRAYLAIERARFGERLRVAESIEPGLDDALVPALVLQPLVENAIRHAVARRVEGGTVRLVARSEAGALARLVLEVCDDGPGPDAGQPAPGHGVGLESVRERLRLAGPPHAFSLDPAPGGGTTARITLPLRVAAAPGTAS